jgi:hypothetical protein
VTVIVSTAAAVAVVVPPVSALMATAVILRCVTDDDVVAITSLALFMSVMYIGTGFKVRNILILILILILISAGVGVGVGVGLLRLREASFSSFSSSTLHGQLHISINMHQPDRHMGTHQVLHLVQSRGELCVNKIARFTRLGPHAFVAIVVRHL